MVIIKNFFKKINENLLVIILIVLAIATRFLPHPPNFTAVGAVALFSGVYLKKEQAMWLPLSVMIISDLSIGLHNLVFFTWGSFFFMGLIGLWVRERKSLPNIILGTLTGSLLFFFITNYAVWAFTPLYEKNINGLLESYVMAIPFFRNSLAGDFFYVSILFGAYEALKFSIPKQERELVKVN